MEPSSFQSSLPAITVKNRIRDDWNSSLTPSLIRNGEADFKGFLRERTLEFGGWKHARFCLGVCRLIANRNQQRSCERPCQRLQQGLGILLQPASDVMSMPVNQNNHSDEMKLNTSV